MQEYNIHHAKGTIIGNLYAKTPAAALRQARKVFGPTVYVTVLPPRGVVLAATPR